MKIYTRFLAACYALGAVLHALDILNLRLIFTNLPTGWKIWIVFLLVADTFAAVGLWQQKFWGQLLFLGIAGTQLVAYTVFSSYFGAQPELLAFHLLTIAIFFGLTTFLDRKFT